MAVEIKNDCKKFIALLDKDILPYESVLMIEEHAKKCFACKILLDCWRLEQIEEFRKDKKQENRNLG